ncbi:MAG: hypothetical protein HY359_15910 [Candidatus Rokubacteria bacterium]|nr:hypothetical protein [Candidatus Rokubacteria bacterium]
MRPRTRLLDPLLAALMLIAGVLAPVAAHAETWRLVNEPGFGNPENASALAMAVFDGHLYVVTRNLSGSEIWKSRLGSEHWRDVTPPWSPGTTRAQAITVFEGRLYVGTDRGEVWRTAG